MAKTRLTCPRCRATFTLQAPSLEGLANKIFKCPKCGYTTSFGQLLGSDARPTVPLRTKIGGGAPLPPGARTVVSAPVISPAVTLRILPAGRSFTLQQGVYTLGRDSSDSQASVRLAPDPYMSRQQVRLEIMHKPGATSCRLICLNTTNPVFVNDRQVDPHFGVELRNGDILLMGMTKVQVNM